MQFIQDFQIERVGVLENKRSRNDNTESPGPGAYEIKEAYNALNQNNKGKLLSKVSSSFYWSVSYRLKFFNLG